MFEPGTHVDSKHLRAVVAAASCLAALACLRAAPAEAGTWALMGGRYQAMGGTGVAFADDSSAVYWNPSNLAWRIGWDVQLPVTIDANVENDALTELSTLIQAADDFKAQIDAFLECDPARPGDCAPFTPTESDQKGFMRFLARLGTYGQKGEAVHGNATFGLTGRYDGFGFSALSLTTATVFPSVDLGNVGLVAGALDRIIGTVSNGIGNCCQTPRNTGLADDLYSAVSPIPGNPWSREQVDHLVWLAEEVGAQTDDPGVRLLLKNVVGNTASGEGLFDNNATGALVAGLSTQEFGISYARKIPVPYFSRTQGTSHRILRYLHNRTALGATLKYMLGFSFLRVFRYDDADSPSDVLLDWIGSESRRISHNVGLDLGFSMRPVDWLQLGMVARNVNGPKFEVAPYRNPLTGLWTREIGIDPTVRVGVAVLPIDHLTLACDVDATLNHLATLPLFSSRIVSLGAEYDIPIGRHLGLALRLGGYTNVSDAVDDDWAMTGGLGMKLGGFILDLAVGAAFADEIVQTGSTSYERLPSRFNLGVGFKWDASI